VPFDKKAGTAIASIIEKPHNPQTPQKYSAAFRKIQDTKEMTKMATETKKTESPPYIAYGTFLSFIKGLQKTGIPSRIDKSLLRNMSGGNQSALLAALRWFQLIDEVGAHGARLEALVNAGEDAAKQLGKILPDAYTFMTDGTIALDKATGAQVEEKFRAYGLSGSTVIKTMAFFITACKEAGIPLSAHIKLPKAARPNGSAKAKKGQRHTFEDEDDVDESARERVQTAHKTAADALMDKFPSFDPSWPENIQQQWFAAFSKMQDMVKDKDK
jgi:hypothetical protein